VVFGLVSALILVAGLFAIAGGGTYIAYRLFRRDR
jgi:hypothetical protein